MKAPLRKIAKRKSPGLTERRVREIIREEMSKNVKFTPKPGYW